MGPGDPSATPPPRRRNSILDALNRTPPPAAALGALDDSDSDEDETLTEHEGVQARRLMLRMQLRRWETQFVQREGRAATYDDKKLDRPFQEMRSRMRRLDLEARAARMQDADAEAVLAMFGEDSSRSGGSGGATSRRRGSIADRERHDGQMRSLREATRSSSRASFRGNASRASFRDSRASFRSPSRAPLASRRSFSASPSKRPLRSEAMRAQVSIRGARSLPPPPEKPPALVLAPRPSPRASLHRSPAQRNAKSGNYGFSAKRREGLGGAAALATGGDRLEGAALLT